MAKFGHIELKVGKDHTICVGELSDSQKEVLMSRNIIYIYRSTRSRKIYIGQSVNFLKRHSQHFDGREKKFDDANFNQVIVLYSQLFNKSALDDVEAKLIMYFSADNSNVKRQNVFSDSHKLLNLTIGNNVNNYSEQKRIADEVILPFWEEVLYEKGWVDNKTLDKIRLDALVKYSPIKVLTQQQHEIIDRVIDNPNVSFTINGDAGTGKTVLLTHLVASLNDRNNNLKIAIVVQPNWVKMAKKIFKVYGLLDEQVTVTTSIRLINSNKEYDSIIVDESHKMSRRGNKQLAAFNDVYNGRFEKFTNHLDILKQMGKQVILMYDVLQAIRPANIPRDVFKKSTHEFQKEYLTTQFRIKTPVGKKYTSDDYVNGIKYLLYKDTDLLNEVDFNPDFDRDVFRDKNPDAYFSYVSRLPLHASFDWIDEKRNLYPDTVNRVLAGLFVEWKQADGRDKSKTHWQEGDLLKSWNSSQKDWLEAEGSEDQIGSVFAVQGIDLNYVGVLIGNDLDVDDGGRLIANSDNFKNVNGIFTKKEMKSPFNQKEFTLFVLNIYYVLLTRGIDGVRIGLYDNEKFEKYMRETLEL